MLEHNKCAIILFGESFRTGSQGSRAKGRPDAVAEQLDAARSHQEFIDYLTSQHNVQCGIYIHTYSTPYDDFLLACYKQVTAKRFLTTEGTTSGMSSHVDGTMRLIDEQLAMYDFCLFIRIDLHLKSYFTKRFNLQQFCTRLTFPSICFLKNNSHVVSGTNYPRVNHIIVGVPRMLYKLLQPHITPILFEHVAFAHLSPMLPTNCIEFMVSTYHDSDSEKDWNPLYDIVNRPRKPVWHSVGFVYNHETMEPMEDPHHPQHRATALEFAVSEWVKK
jgi:hypothetical protein